MTSLPLRSILLILIIKLDKYLLILQATEVYIKNSTNQFDQNNGNIMLSLDGSYLNNVYTKSDSDLRYPVKAIDGTNTNISLDTKYRIQSDGTNF